MDLNRIEQKGSWGGQAANLNHNFSRIDTEMVKLASATGKLCGYFTDIDSLSALHPAPVVGMLAYIGKTSPYAVYICKVAGKWESTGESFIPIVSVPDIVQKDGNSTTSVMSQAAVAKIISQYDVSASNGGAKYALQEAIDAVPLHFQKGGLSVKFVDSTTNEYATFHNTSDKWTTDIAKWKSIDDSIIKETKESSVICGNLNLEAASSFEFYKLGSKTFVFEHNAVVTKIIFGTDRVFAENQKVEIFEHVKGSNTAVNTYELTLEAGKNYIECNLQVSKGNVLLIQNKKYVNTSGVSLCLIGTDYSAPMYAIDTFGVWTERKDFGGMFDMEFRETIEYSARDYTDKRSKETLTVVKEYADKEITKEDKAVKDYIDENVLKKYQATEIFGYDELGSAFVRKLQILSAGDQQPFKEDVVVTKLIFHDDIASIVTEDREIEVYDCRFGVNDKIGYKATLKAHTNYAICDFTLRKGSVVMVKDIMLANDVYLVTTLYNAEGYYIDQSNLWSVASAHAPRFNFEYKIKLSRLDELLNNEGNVTSYENTDFVLVFGSSLTDHSMSMRGHSWCEKINDIVDIPISNHAQSGSTLSANLGMLLSVADDLRPSYVWWNNEANGTKSGKEALPHLIASKEICDSINAKMILGGENGTANGNISLEDVDKTYEQFAKDHRLIHSELRREIPNVGATYRGFDSGVHQGYRNQACFFKHVEVFDSLHIRKSVKAFIVRPKSADKDVSELCYDNNYQRLLNFRAASSGTKWSRTSAQIDNLDNNSYVVSGGTDNGSKAFETDNIVIGKEIVCYKKAVVEFITDTIGLTKGTFVATCNIKPANIYVANVRSTSRVYDGSVRSVWEKVDFDFHDSTVIVRLGRKNADVQLYDKLRFLIECEGAFNLSKPIFKGYNGAPKNVVKSYKQRQYGVELNDNTLMADGWTLNGATIETAPNVIGLYKAGTSHIKLGSKGNNVTKNITIPKGTRRVAIRIVAQRFLPIATKRFESNADVQNSGYVTLTPAIEAYDNDTSLMGVLINNAAYSERLVHQGWHTDYIEYDTDTTDEVIKIELSKISDDTVPLFIYSVSIQKID